MLITKGITAELKPNRSQKEWLAQQFGNVRFVWNYYLSLLQKRYRCAKKYKKERQAVPENLRFPRKYDLYNTLKVLKQKFTWLNRSDSRSLQCELGTLYQTYLRLFKHQSNAPRFKFKKCY